MLKKNRNARLQGAMALVASATAELQRLKPRALGAVDVVAKATTDKDSPDLTRTRKTFSPRGSTAGRNSLWENTKFTPSAAKAPPNLRRLRHG